MWVVCKPVNNNRDLVNLNHFSTIALAEHGNCFRLNAYEPGINGCCTVLGEFQSQQAAERVFKELLEAIKLDALMYTVTESEVGDNNVGN